MEDKEESSSPGSDLEMSDDGEKDCDGSESDGEGSRSEGEEEDDDEDDGLSRTTGTESQADTLGNDDGDQSCVEEEDDRCDICGDSTSYEDDPILLCDGCDVPVHKHCYGVKVIPEDDWFCDACARDNPAKNATCSLCAKTGGAFMQTTNEGVAEWVHVSCVNWLLELDIDLDESRTIDVTGVNADRKRIKCTVCNQRGRLDAIQCSYKRCARGFHVRCVIPHNVAQERGDLLYPTIGIGEMPKCAKHGKKGLDMRRRMEELEESEYSRGDGGLSSSQHGQEFEDGDSSTMQESSMTMDQEEEEEISEYERLRRQRIAENAQFLAQLGLANDEKQSAGALGKLAAAESDSKQRRPRKKRDVEPARRSSRAKEPVSYAELAFHRSAEEIREERADKRLMRELKRMKKEEERMEREGAPQEEVEALRERRFAKMEEHRQLVEEQQRKKQAELQARKQEKMNQKKEKQEAKEKARLERLTQQLKQQAEKLAERQRVEEMRLQRKQRKREEALMKQRRRHERALEAEEKKRMVAADRESKRFMKETAKRDKAQQLIQQRADAKHRRRMFEQGSQRSGDWDVRAPVEWSELDPETFGALAASKAKCVLCAMGAEEPLSKVCGNFICPPFLTGVTQAEVNAIVQHHRTAVPVRLRGPTSWSKERKQSMKVRLKLTGKLLTPPDPQPSMPDPEVLRSIGTRWIHEQCAQICPRVFLDEDDHYYNVSEEVRRGRMLVCGDKKHGGVGCMLRGATIGCEVRSCRLSYHYPCAVEHTEWEFRNSRRFFCHQHRQANYDTEVHCICGAVDPDGTDFYVCCDTCDDWFHPQCVGLSEKEANELEGWKCLACADSEVYCVCQKPYDGFYLGCEMCQGWFHPGCIGVSDEEAKEFDENPDKTFLCPTCKTMEQRPTRRRRHASSSSSALASKSAHKSAPIRKKPPVVVRAMREQSRKAPPMTPTASLDGLDDLAMPKPASRRRKRSWKDIDPTMSPVATKEQAEAKGSSTKPSSFSLEDLPESPPATTRCTPTARTPSSKTQQRRQPSASSKTSTKKPKVEASKSSRNSVKNRGEGKASEQARKTPNRRTENKGKSSKSTTRHGTKPSRRASSRSSAKK